MDCEGRLSPPLLHPTKNCPTVSQEDESRDNSAVNSRVLNTLTTSLSTRMPDMVISLESQDLSSIPESLLSSACMYATELYLDYNALTEIPEEFCANLRNLRVLSIIGNFLDELPGSLNYLTELTQLHVNENQLRYLPPSLCTLRNLVELNIVGNKIVHLPTEFGRLTSLKRFIAYENLLEDLPESFGLLRSLEVLELGDNLITHLPINFGCLGELRSMNISCNKLTEIEHTAYLPMLEILEISNNRITCLPNQLHCRHHLKKLFANNCHLQHMPSWVGDLTAIEELSFENNQVLESPFPESFGDRSQSLRVLTIGSNYIRFLPDSLGRLSSLERIHIGSIACELERRNYQNGNWIYRLPESFSLLVNLRYANLNENQICELPLDFGLLVNLEWLDLGQNRLVDLPESFGNLRSLKFCQLSKNNIEHLPSSFGNLSSLEEIRLDWNRLAEFPLSFARLTQLKTLDLYHNSLTELPSFLDDFKNLIRLDVSENQLQMSCMDEPRIFKPQEYAARDPALKNNWRGKYRKDPAQDAIFAEAAKLRTDSIVNSSLEPATDALSNVRLESNGDDTLETKVEATQGNSSANGSSALAEVEAAQGNFSANGSSFALAEVEAAKGNSSANGSSALAAAIRGGTSLWRTHNGSDQRSYGGFVFPEITTNGYAEERVEEFREEEEEEQEEDAQDDQDNDYNSWVASRGEEQEQTAIVDTPAPAADEIEENWDTEIMGDSNYRPVNIHAIPQPRNDWEVTERALAAYTPYVRSSYFLPAVTHAPPIKRFQQNTRQSHWTYHVKPTSQFQDADED